MKRALTIFGLFALAAVIVIGCGGQSIADEEKPAEHAKIVVKKAQSLCPIMGNPVDKNVHYDYEGRRIYFCCAPCIEKFKEDPDGFMKKMEAEGIALEKVAGELDHDHGEHDHGEGHDHADGDHDHDKDHDHDADQDKEEGHDHDHDDHAGHDHD